MKRSILTEKISRRGYHLSREYALDPLEILFVREVMRTNVVALPADAPLEEAREAIRPTQKEHGQHLFPIIEKDRELIGVVSRNHLMKLFAESPVSPATTPLREIASGFPVVARADEPLRVVVYRMVETGLTRLPVVDPGDDKRLLGMVSLQDLLVATQPESGRRACSRARPPSSHASRPPVEKQRRSP